MLPILKINMLLLRKVFNEMAHHFLLEPQVRIVFIWWLILECCSREKSDITELTDDL